MRIKIQKLICPDSPAAKVFNPAGIHISLEKCINNGQAGSLKCSRKKIQPRDGKAHTIWWIG